MRLGNSSKSSKPGVLKKLENDVEKALCCRNILVRPNELVCEQFNGESRTINIDGSNPKHVTFDNLSTTDHTKVKTILQVCGNAMISESAYHELTMQVDTFPRKCTFIACRNEINSFDVMRTPGLLLGSYVGFKTEKLTIILKCLKVCKNKQQLKIKISGGDAKVSRISNFIVTK